MLDVSGLKVKLSIEWIGKRVLECLDTNFRCIWMTACVAAPVCWTMFRWLNVSYTASFFATFCRARVKTKGLTFARMRVWQILPSLLVYFQQAKGRLIDSVLERFCGPIIAKKGFTKCNVDEACVYKIKLTKCNGFAMKKVATFEVFVLLLWRTTLRTLRRKSAQKANPIYS